MSFAKCGGSMFNSQTFTERRLSSSSANGEMTPGGLETATSIACLSPSKLFWCAASKR